MPLGLIETWDVLKCKATTYQYLAVIRLIETWDVLKFPNTSAQGADSVINRNMGCIEIGNVYTVICAVVD